MRHLMLDYLPSVLQGVRDFRCLMGQYQIAVDELWQSAGETEDDFYLKTAGERGLAHWENILGIVPETDAVLDERRQVIYARLSQNIPYGWRTLLAFLTALVGSERGFAAEISAFTLTVRLRPLWRERWDVVWDLLRYIVPANVEIHLRTAYNTHGELSTMTHAEMGAYTHEQLRSEEIL
ncbi:MAG: YmfQ family protein [Oscillospiraceae bacterium]|nr:YmfQ family protein [Oscillospiraceae bacterium]